MDGWMGGWLDGWMGGRVDGWMSGWVDGWMGGWVDGWMDRWKYTRFVCVHSDIVCRVWSAELLAIDFYIAWPLSATSLAVCI